MRGGAWPASFVVEHSAPLVLAPPQADLVVQQPGPDSLVSWAGAGGARDAGRKHVFRRHRQCLPGIHLPLPDPQIYRACPRSLPPLPPFPPSPSRRAHPLPSPPCSPTRVPAHLPSRARPSWGVLAATLGRRLRYVMDHYTCTSGHRQQHAGTSQPHPHPPPPFTHTHTHARTQAHTHTHAHTYNQTTPPCEPSAWARG